MCRRKDRPAHAVLHAGTGAHVLEVRIADSFIKRFVGLMLAAPLLPSQGLLITQCRSVHTFFMRQTIDVLYLDKSGRVIKCVPRLKPGRISNGHYRCAAKHTLELAAGTIERLGVRCGDRLEHPLWTGPEHSDGYGAAPELAPTTENEHEKRRGGAFLSIARQRGAAILEFTVVGPILTLIGMAILQYGMLFFAKNQINHAGFIAARAGAMANASLDSVRNAYETALIPLYGGGTSDEQLQESLDKVKKDMTEDTLKIEMLNPTKESFDDWNDPALSEAIGGGKRVIPNSGQAFKDPNAIGANSGQSIQDANLIKLRITHGYEMKVPLISTVMQFMLRWSDKGEDDFISKLYADRRIPVVTHVTLQMQSDAIEPDNGVSIPGKGNDGSPVDPGKPASSSTEPPKCLTIGCTVIIDPNGTSSPTGSGTGTGTGSGTGTGTGTGSGTGIPPLFSCPPGDPTCTQMCTAAIKT